LREKKSPWDRPGAFLIFFASGWGLYAWQTLQAILSFEKTNFGSGRLAFSLEPTGGGGLAGTLDI
jgi:hypothetical protein